MKKLLALLLLIAVLITIVGCTKPEKNVEAEKAPATKPQTESIEATEATVPQQNTEKKNFVFKDTTSCKITIEGKEIELPIKYADFMQMFDCKIQSASGIGIGEDTKVYSGVSINGKDGITLIVKNYEVDPNIVNALTYMKTGDIVGLQIHIPSNEVEIEYEFDVDKNYKVETMAKKYGEPDACDEILFSTFYYAMPNLNFNNEKFGIEFGFDGEEGNIETLQIGVFATALYKIPD